MFDIAFSELVVIGVVALVVVGPERLPKVARTAGRWMGKLNSYVAKVKEDVDREMKLEELKKLQEDMKASAQKYEILATETELKLKRELDPGEKLSLALGVTDGPIAQLAKAAAQTEFDGPHAIIEYAYPASVSSPIATCLNETVGYETPVTEPVARMPDERQSSLF